MSAKQHGTATASLAIVTEYGPRTVPAVLYGPLAVHRAFGEPGWGLTHAESGRSIVVFRRKAMAETAANLFASLDWTWDGNGVPDETKQAVMGGLALLEVAP